MKKIVQYISLILTAFILVACASDDSSNEEQTAESPEEKSTIKLGVDASGQLMTDYVESYLKDHGYDVELIVLEQAIPSNEGVQEGSIDINFVQNENYMEQFNQDRNADLVRVGDYLYEQFVGIFSENLDDLSDIEDGAKVSIQNDASNRTRALRALESAGLIKIKDDVSDSQTLTSYDIAENPYNLEFIEMASGQMVQSLPDVDLAVLRGRTLNEAGYSPEDALFAYEDGDISSNALILATKFGNEDSEWAQLVHQAFQAPETVELVKKETGGTWQPYFEVVDHE